MSSPRDHEEALVEEYKQTLILGCRECLVADLIIRGNLAIEKIGANRIIRTKAETEELIKEQLGSCLLGLTLDKTGHQSCGHPLYSSWSIAGPLEKIATTAEEV
jgi:hypothetical protein